MQFQPPSNSRLVVVQSLDGTPMFYVFQGDETVLSFSNRAKAEEAAEEIEGSLLQIPIRLKLLASTGKVS